MSHWPPPCQSTWGHLPPSVLLTNSRCGLHSCQHAPCHSNRDEEISGCFSAFDVPCLFQVFKSSRVGRWHFVCLILQMTLWPIHKPFGNNTKMCSGTHIIDGSSFLFGNCLQFNNVWVNLIPPQNSAIVFKGWAYIMIQSNDSAKALFIGSAIYL